MSNKSWIGNTGTYRETSEDGSKSWVYEKSVGIAPPTLIEIAEHDQEKGTTQAWEANQGFLGGKGEKK